MRQDAKLALLKGVPIFKGLSKKELAAVSKATEQLEYGAGEVLARQDSVGNEAYVVVEGSITVRRNGRKVATLGPGDVAGEMALLDDEPRSADLVAAQDSVVLYISRREFGGLLEANTKLMSKVLRTLAQRLREADRNLYG
ncbi:MAG TPA: cyclic nucleotide-binding domain-containing protein [Acidimicrobiia bacterium]|nr:cyclic nucleotide-binding domain-containing protein [Acidimicrobiia bacterium]